MSNHDDDRLVYLMAVDWLCQKSRWPRKDVIADGTSAGWFVAQRAKTDEDKEEAHRMGYLVAKGKP